MPRTIIDIHVLQTVPPSNINRDDTGSPKTASYGGVRRARVSSQAWKRAIRKHMAGTAEALATGVRSKRVVELLGEEIRKQSDSTSQDASHELAKAVLTAGGITVKPPRKGKLDESGYLLFLSAQQVESLAAYALTAGEDLVKKDIQALIKNKNSIDLAMFGRMVADVADLNVDASVQVAHALSVHAVENEFDYFTAVDDHKENDDEEDAGAGMIGTIEFNSSTLYRYATIDADLLARNLGEDAPVGEAVGAFLRSFVRSIPSGKKNTFANGTLPDAIVVAVRQDQSISYVGAFETPVQTAAGSGRVTAAVEALARYAKDVADAYNADPDKVWVTAVGAKGAALDQLGDRVSLGELVDQVITTVSDRTGAAVPTPAGQTA
ncbi:type I-E CRISPR-associated protein Cas7/Cse4/CasC [Myceligenerans sp. TRM 65318]|uniref:Type I-E CRISPR-associated protein Cas7/Cse4/CasC n=2 Tax=Myceligenerans pegani TaxID=2776917 RepID=A0ABR9N1C5_9MICO|nr:type I-E CRISPR-associated protein Cas7/Cse4/CasC [Myceligenerans sp. TRM 65318]MBE3019724.1 type I-E CRISPR-associated protein Cas7/Cse4/CasC [Myceligenerans sp. TRM 65318]